jgi:hypothetical protein
VSYSEHLARFIDAKRAGDTAKAVAAAEGMMEEGEGVAIHDAMELVILFARDEDPRFEAAAGRWVERLAGEGRLLVEVEIAAAAVQGLCDRRVSRRCEAVLRKLMSWVEESG